MPRHKEFDRTEVLDRALELFWHRGYEGTSMQQLVDAMGIHRGSLYGTFGDKHALFLAALRRYDELWISRFVEPLSAPGPVRPAVRRVLEQAGREATEGVRRGCLATNSAVELAPHDPELARRVRAMLSRVEGALRAALERARGTGELSADVDPPAVARFLIGVLQGLRVLSRMGAEPETLRDTVEVSMKALE